MIDQIFDRQYREARTELNAAIGAGLSRASRSILKAFEVLNRIEYAAPWATQRKQARSI